MTTEAPTKNRLRSQNAAISKIGQVWAFLHVFKGSEKVLVLVNPDPDSMATALAVKRLLWKRVKQCVIAHIGKIERLENQALVDLLKIPVRSIEKVDVDTFTSRILVDSQPHHSEVFGQFTYDAIIDHHPKIQNWKVPHVDIRPAYGATATILTEYLREANTKPSMKLATALLYAIKTDTANFERDATKEDVKQFRYLFQYANLNRLKKIERSELRLRDLRDFQTALENRAISRKRLYAHLGGVRAPDICVQVADFFMRVYGMGWSFASGVSDDRLIIIIRNDGFRKDAGKLAVAAFGPYGSAGGHRGAARAEIPLEDLRRKGVRLTDEALEDFVKERLNF